MLLCMQHGQDTAAQATNFAVSKTGVTAKDMTAFCAAHMSNRGYTYLQ